MASLSPKFDVHIKNYVIEYNGKKMEEERIVNAIGISYELYRSVSIKKELPIGKMKIKADIKEIPKMPLFTQSEVISKMKEKGIGRPSTYATIIEKLFMRNYITEKNGKLFPTKMGKEVFNYLNKNYGKFISEERIRILQEEMGMVENGKEDYLKILDRIYKEIREIE